jgi:hypothetical protein
MKFARAPVLAVLLSCGLAPAASAAPANSMSQLADQIAACLVMPGDGDLTLIFTIGRDGRLLGTPHIDYDKLALGEKQARAANAAILAALERCLPAEITPALGRIVAGRSVKLRFKGKRRELDV